MMFGEEMRLPFDIALEPKDSLPQDYRDYLSQFIANLKIAHEIVQENEAQSKEKDKVRHDKRAQVQNFGIGDLVLLNVHKVPKGLSRKHFDKSGGPYRMDEIGQNYTYVIRRLSDNNRLNSVINATNLKLYVRPETVRDKLNSQQIADNVPDADPDSDDDSSQVQTVPNPQPTPAVPNTQPTPATPNTQPAPKNPYTKVVFNKLLRARRRHGRREVYVKWFDGSCNWEPDSSFDKEMLDFINSKFTKKGTRRKSQFKPVESS